MMLICLLKTKTKMMRTSLLKVRRRNRPKNNNLPETTTQKISSLF